MTLFLNKRQEPRVELGPQAQQAQQAQRESHLKAAAYLARASSCHKDAAMYCALGNTENAQKNIDMATAHIEKAMECVMDAHKNSPEAKNMDTSAPEPEGTNIFRMQEPAQIQRVG